MIAINIPETGVSLNGRKVLSGFSATLSKGELVGIVGPNGAGKSTLLKLVAGLLPQSDEAVTLNGSPVASLKPAERARRIAWLSQSRELSWDLSVEDVVALGRHAWGGGRFGRLGDTDRALVIDAIARAGASHLCGRHVLSLSGGEQARVHLARLFAVGADALLLDEPLAALDVAQQLSVFAALEAERDSDKLVCLALHDLRLAAQKCSRVLVLDKGLLVADGPPGTALSDEILESVFAVRPTPAGGFEPA